jgi:hypothetical protein
MPPYLFVCLLFIFVKLIIFPVRQIIYLGLLSYTPVRDIGLSLPHVKLEKSKNKEIK